MGFNNLSTVSFHNKMRPRAVEIYQKIFKGCSVEHIKSKDGDPHVLDKYFGIDCIIKFASGQFITVQEKYRTNDKLSYGDFTQEYKNAQDTEHEHDGEFFNLAAQVYFYGWASKDCLAFEKWLLLNIYTYKALIENAGGLQGIGTIQQNSVHGKASFFSIPLSSLTPAIITSSENYTEKWTAEKAIAGGDGFVADYVMGKIN